jgi:MtN3 and saliva related transmembrane protein
MRCLRGLLREVSMSWAVIVGSLAALASMVSFAPQAWRIIKSRRTDGISSAAYSITVAAFALWVLYGALIGEWPLIVSNVVCLVLSAFILVMTLLPQREKDDVAKALDPER